MAGSTNCLRYERRYSYWRRLQVALQHVLERVDMHAKPLQRKVFVYADEVPDQERHAHTMQLYFKI